jgi:hypothetical protein
MRRRIVDVTLVVPTPDDVILIGPMRPELFCVVYRTGGTVNFKWRRTLAMTREEVAKAYEDVTRMGYACHIEDFFASVAIGLPTTFSPDFPDETEWH